MDDIDVLGHLELSDGETPEGWRYAYELSDGWLWVAFGQSILAGAPDGFVSYQGRYLPEAFRVLVEFRDVPYPVVLTYQMADGEPRLRGLKLIPERRARTVLAGPDGGISGHLQWTERTEITSAGLRQVPVQRLQQLAVLAAVHAEPGPGTELRFDDWTAFYSAQTESGAQRPRSARLDDEHYERVAELYRTSLSTGKPTEAVMRGFHASRSTAGRWVVEARRRGHLGRTRPGRAGESPKQRGRIS